MPRPHAGYPPAMRLPPARGPISEAVTDALRSGRPVTSPEVGEPADVLTDDDVQLTLWVLHDLHYAAFDDVVGDREWDPGIIGLRQRLSDLMETQLRPATTARIEQAREAADDIAEQVFAMTQADEGPSLAAYLQRKADRAEYLEFLTHRSVVALKETDAVAWTLPRVRTPGAKAVLAELLYDEYGGGRPAQVHAHLFAEAMRASGLSPEPGAYAARLPAVSLAVDNLTSLLGLQRRLRGAALGHFAAFEATSSLPCRRLSRGAERLGLAPEVAGYWDEHVEADAVHEQLAVRGVCGALVAAEPDLADDVLFGAAACLEVEARFGAALLESFAHGRSSLREEAA